jgi:hypothetical protein
MGQLHRIIRTRAANRGYELVVKKGPWHIGGSVRRVGRTIYVRISNKLSPADQLHAFAHECGHLLFGHYEIDGEVWTLTSGPGADEWEWEADLFAQFATRTPGTPAEWFIGGQLDLRV